MMIQIQKWNNKKRNVKIYFDFQVDFGEAIREKFAAAVRCPDFSKVSY